VKRFWTTRKAYSVTGDQAAQDGRQETVEMLDKTDDIALAARDWLLAFEAALATQDHALDRLFHTDSYWRDVLALSWNLQTVNGAPGILAELKRLAPQAAL
jgi:hypothetical protein